MGPLYDGAYILGKNLVQNQIFVPTDFVQYKDYESASQAADCPNKGKDGPWKVYKIDIEEAPAEEYTPQG